MEKILEEVRILIKENILPRLTDLEEEVRLLRKVTWPVCQRLTEKHQMDDLESKYEFLKYLDMSEIEMLLRRKSESHLLQSEFMALVNLSK
jgi:hypothetical protein